MPRNGHRKDAGLSDLEFRLARTLFDLKQAQAEHRRIEAKLQETQTRLEARVSERTQELTESHRHLRSLGERLVLAHESEQRRIARELHDQIGQDLTALKMILSRGKGGKPEQALECLAEAQSLSEELLETVRGICSTLRPQVLDDLGLVAGVQWHIKTFSERTGMDVTFDMERIDESHLSPLVKSAVFRVIQEALTNVSRHGETKSASVMLAMRKGFLEFSIRDGGKGFDAARIAGNPSTGLSSMRERLSLVGGVFELSSFPGQGTIIKAQIPVALPSESETNLQQNTRSHGKSSANQSRHRRRPSSRAKGS